MTMDPKMMKGNPYKSMTYAIHIKRSLSSTVFCNSVRQAFSSPAGKVVAPSSIEAEGLIDRAI